MEGQMTTIKSKPTIPEALAALCDLSMTDPLFTRLVREHNHYIDCLHSRGDRYVLNSQDFHVLLCRMLDIAQIEPIAPHQEDGDNPPPPPLPGGAFRLTLAKKD
jgi:hypothetical protein